jgi:SAM-dependent methyltransferase
VGFQQGNALALPFREGRFDVALLLGDVLTYPSVFGSHDRVLSELLRVLSKGGTAVHECMNWDWEYRSYPGCGASFTRAEDGRFRFHRTKRTVSGLETARDYHVVPETPLNTWILEQDWPASPQGLNTLLEVKEKSPLPEKWLRFSGVSRYKHYRPDDLRRLYIKAGFCEVEVFAYGQTYDIAFKAGVLQRIEPFQTRLAVAEAELAHELRQGSGPWLFLVAET